jgi:glycosyltransferase involved in cell wall biosynthesis
VTCLPFFDTQYLRRLYITRDRGIKDLLRAYAKRLAALRQAQYFSAVWVEKELLPFAPGWFEGWLARAGVPYVVDYDDATFHTYDEHRQPLVRRWLGRKLDPLLAGAFAVSTGNRYLSDYARAHGARRVVQVPTVVDLERYPITQVTAPLSGPELRIGWIGTPATSKYLEILREPLRRLSADVPLRLVTIGAPPDLDLGIPMEKHAWSEATEASLLATLDIGVMPLPDAPWERGKCGYKLIQYMALGKPVIASPVGVNRELITPDVGLLASSAQEWMAALASIAQHRETVVQQGQAGRRLVEQTYSLQAQAPIICQLLCEAAGSRIPATSS